jgi:hypothetical protein
MIDAYTSHSHFVRTFTKKIQLKLSLGASPTLLATRAARAASSARDRWAVIDSQRQVRVCYCPFFWFLVCVLFVKLF